MRVLVLCMLLGCALTQQKHLPDPRCETAKTYVVVDSVLAVVAVGVGIGIAAAGSSTNSSNLEAGGAAVGFLWGGTHVVSAVMGNNWANSCRENTRSYRERTGPVAR